MASLSTSSKKRDAANSNVVVEVNNAHKRKRYVMDDDAFSQKEVSIRDRLNVASMFGKNSNVENSAWLSKRGDRMASVDAIVGTAIVVPVDLPDVGEAADEAWASSSNWYCCIVGKVNVDLTIQIKVLGTIMPMEEQFLATGWSATVNPPLYVLTSKGKMKEKHDELLEASCVELVVYQEGETVVKPTGIKSISLYGIPDLDGIPRPCSMKTEGIKRMLKVAGLVRLTGERFDRLVVDLSYCRETFMSTCQRYAESSEGLPKDSPFKSFVKLPKLSGLPVQDNVETLEMLMMGDYPLYDRSRISLKDFLSFKSDSAKWGKSPTREGRAAFTDAFTNFQKVLVVYFGNCYSTCFEDLLGILNEDDDVLQDYNDSYIQVKFEMTISLFYHDVYKEKSSLSYPEMLMTTPSQCAALLKHYLYEELQRARGLSETNKWERHPHSKFYSQEGTFSKVRFHKSVKLGVKPVNEEKGVNKLPCVWHLAEQLKVRNMKDQIVTCRKASCEWPHKAFTNCTREEVLAKVDTLGKLKGQYIKQMSTIELKLKDSQYKPK